MVRAIGHINDCNHIVDLNAVNLVRMQKLDASKGIDLDDWLFALRTLETLLRLVSHRTQLIDLEEALLTNFKPWTLCSIEFTPQADQLVGLQYRASSRTQAPEL